MTAALAVALAVALVGPLGAYLIAARKASGKIATSDAAELWKESGSIREDYRDRLRYADEELRALRRHVQEIDEENRGLHRRVRELEKYVTRLGGEINGGT